MRSAHRVSHVTVGQSYRAWSEQEGGCDCISSRQVSLTNDWLTVFDCPPLFLSVLFAVHINTRWNHYSDNYSIPQMSVCACVFEAVFLNGALVNMWSQVLVKGSTFDVQTSATMASTHTQLLYITHDCNKKYLKLSVPVMYCNTEQLTFHLLFQSFCCFTWSSWHSDKCTKKPELSPVERVVCDTLCVGHCLLL